MDTNKCLVFVLFTIMINCYHSDVIASSFYEIQKVGENMKRGKNKEKILLFFYNTNLKPLQFFYDKRGKSIEKDMDYCSLSNKKNPPLSIKVEKTLYNKYQEILSQDWTTDSLLDIRTSYRLCIGVWSCNGFSHKYVTLDKSCSFLSNLIAVSEKSVNARNILSAYKNTLFEDNKESYGRCIVMNELCLVPKGESSMKTPEEIIFAKGEFKSNVIDWHSYTQLLNYINQSTLVQDKPSGKLGDLEILILNKGHFAKRFVEKRHKCFFIKDVRNYLVSFRNVTQQLDIMESIFHYEERKDSFLAHIDDTEDKIVFEQIGERDIIIYPIQISYKAIGRQSLKGVTNYAKEVFTENNNKTSLSIKDICLNILEKYHYKVSETSYNEMVDSILDGNFQTPVVPITFNGTLRITVFKSGEYVVSKIVTLDKLKIFINQQLKILRKNGEECLDLELWGKKFGTPLIKRFFTLLDFPDCYYQVNQMLFYGKTY